MKLPLFAIPLLLLGGASATHGAIIYSGVQDLVIPPTFTGIYLNVVTGTTSLGQPGDFDTAPWLNLDFGGVDISNGDLLQIQITGAGQALRLQAPDTVSAADNFANGANFSSNHTGPAPDQFQPAVPGYAGFRFQTSAGGPTHYGWINLMINNNTNGTAHSWAWESVAGVAIPVGAVPEPAGTSLVLLAFAAGLLRRSRRAGGK